MHGNRKANPGLVEVVCSQLCSYYKPGKHEELACQGYLVLERLALPDISLRGATVEQPRDGVGDKLLIRALCMACPFHEQDCDFMENNALPPCGGFLLLSRLLAAKNISIEAVK